MNSSNLIKGGRKWDPNKKKINQHVTYFDGEYWIEDEIKDAEVCVLF